MASGKAPLSSDTELRDALRGGKSGGNLEDSKQPVLRPWLETRLRVKGTFWRPVWLEWGERRLRAGSRGHVGGQGPNHTQSFRPFVPTNWSLSAMGFYPPGTNVNLAFLQRAVGAQQTFLQ